jgi:hypothetical protein
MDTALERMTREELVAEVRKLGKPSVKIATAVVMNSAGTILHFGAFCQRKRIQCLSCLNGQNHAGA